MQLLIQFCTVWNKGHGWADSWSLMISPDDNDENVTSCNLVIEKSRIYPTHLVVKDRLSLFVCAFTFEFNHRHSSTSNNGFVEQYLLKCCICFCSRIRQLCFLSVRLSSILCVSRIRHSLWLNIFVFVNAFQCLGLFECLVMRPVRDLLDLSALRPGPTNLRILQSNLNLCSCDNPCCHVRSRIRHLCSLSVRLHVVMLCEPHSALVFVIRAFACRDGVWAAFGVCCDWYVLCVNRLCV